jgi:aldehyde dehydrogenase (NAD+)
MEQQEIDALIQTQRAYFESGATLPLSARADALKKLQAAIDVHESELLEALYEDLGKSSSESYMSEIGLVKSEITYMLSHLRTFAAEKRVHTPVSQSVARSYVKPSPRGCVLIMSTWNYPFQLTVEPLVDALAAGNTAVVKPSDYSPKTSEVMQRMLTECFPQELVAVVMGGRDANTCVMKGKFDYIFFTGSQSLGKTVLANAAPNLIPCTLELGGKSPCIVDSTAELKLAARRIVFGKFLNCGQTCVAPDYILCDKAVRADLVRYLQEEIKRQLGEKPLENPDYGHIVNEKHFERLCGLIDADKVVCGGETEPEKRRIAPTILDGVTWDDPVMGEEIFGPILPVLTYESLEQAVQTVNRRQTPLALYFFSGNKENVRYVTDRARFGGGCINDTVMHLTTSAMGFGGCGASGMGAYHGLRGFETFSHRKSIVDKKTFLDIPVRYQPYTEWKDKLVRHFLR